MSRNDVWTDLRGVVGNRGDHASHKDIMHALEGPHGEPLCDFATICEMRDQQATVTKINNSKMWQAFKGKTQAEVVILNTHTMRDMEERRDTPLLLAAAKRPPLVGKFNTAKFPTSVRCTHDPSGRRMQIDCLHNIQSLWMPTRGKAGRIHNRRYVDWADDYHRLTIAGMDSNDVPTGQSMDPFRDEMWRVQFPLGTHKKPRARRAIDGFCVDDRDEGIQVLGKPTARRINVDGTDHFWLKFIWPILVRPGR